MRASVVVPVKDDERIVQCVDSLLKSGAGNLHGIVVVDNGSSEGFAAVVDELRSRPGVRVLSAGGTVYAARNRGVEASEGDVIFFTDADCLVEPGWLDAGLAAIDRGLDVAQGFSDSAEESRTARLIQGRYESQFRSAAAGDGVECDTRNLAVRRSVFERVHFNEGYRRVGDTEFGLTAEALGFKAGFAPDMRLAHAHDGSLDLFVAKQICHGWGAQRLMRERPALKFHGGHLRLTARFGPLIRHLPGGYALGRGLSRATLAGSRLLERPGRRLPFPAALVVLGILDKTGGLAGHLLYRPGDEEPSPSALVGRRLPRD